ncbi:sterol desaturase family protein [Flavobacterium sp. NRK1]|uniref:sterol desaturase family protein n=1 Tax=Flavobacterium sp. NRK1 TaxID=2954929 RepID=UPI0020930912|nr:sterol desaturase family protein [Flavobacterium sp. NRK1]MCO6149449.1 sterol desaturase family protein [Flavobacterium sp. NRK1]
MIEIIRNASIILGATLLRYFFIAGVAFLFFYIFLNKRFKTGKIQAKVLKKKDIIREVLHSCQSAAVFTGITLLILFSPIKEYTLIYDNVNDYSYWWLIISIVVSFVIHDTYFYWMHRLLHHRKIYKYTHVVHHRSINPSPWASYSFHILEAIPEGLVLLLLAFILPMHIIAISLFTIIGLIINVYGHLGYEIAPKAFRGTVFFKIVNTSVHHNLHHSRFHGNYSLYFRFWDRIMNTEITDYEKHYDLLQKKRFPNEKA